MAAIVVSVVDRLEAVNIVVKRGLGGAYALDTRARRAGFGRPVFSGPQLPPSPGAPLCHFAPPRKGGFYFVQLPAG